jgi:Fe-S-cluster containining protein
MVPTKPCKVEYDGRVFSAFAFECGWFDKETHLCKNFEKRPIPCRSYICKTAVDILALVEEPVEDLPW